MSRTVIFPYVEQNGKIVYPFEGVSMFNGPMETIDVGGVPYVIAQYRGAATEAELPTYVPLSVDVVSITGAGVLLFDPANPSEAVIKKGSEVVITANSNAPEGSWFTPIQSPSHIKYAPVVKAPATTTIDVAVIFDESGDWYLTEALINRDLPPESQFEFGGLHIKVTL